MTLFLLFVSAQMAGNGIACLIAAVAWHFTRPRIVDIGKTARRDGVGSFTSEVEPC